MLHSATRRFRITLGVVSLALLLPLGAQAAPARFSLDQAGDAVMSFVASLWERLGPAGPAASGRLPHEKDGIDFVPDGKK